MHKKIEGNKTERNEFRMRIKVGNGKLFAKNFKAQNKIK